MRIMRGLMVLSIFSVSAIAGDRSGVPPRGDVRDYPAHTQLDGVALGATLLTAKQVRSSFATDIYRDYAVVEVAVYPAAGQTLAVARNDFVLRMDQTPTRPADPKAIAAILQRDGSGGRSVSVYPTVGVGYESGGYDPITGTNRGGGVHTGVGVGVGIGGSPSATPPRSPADRNTMELELTEKGLVEGPAAQPTAGYLYFPLPEKKKKAAYHLEYNRNGQRVLLRLEPDGRVK